MTADNPATVSNFVMRDAPDKLVNDVEALGRTLDQAKASIGRVIFGQHEVIEQTLITIMSGGHVLLIGVPGLAKTKLVETLGVVFGMDEARIQCTPDLMPADIIGSEVLEEAESGRRSFRFIRGPVFCQLLMADEINRASPRTQSALLQAMQEKRVSIAGQYHPLPEPFHVLATQNPLEQEGTYPLPEAQLDRFLMHVQVNYPPRDAEAEIMRLVRGEENSRSGKSKGPEVARLDPKAIFDARRQIGAVTLAEPVENYIVALVYATREPAKLDKDLAKWIQVGVSPRGSIGLDKVARSNAWFKGRDYATPDDVKSVVHDVFRHRLILSYEAHAAGVTADQVIDRVVELVAVA